MCPPLRQSKWKIQANRPISMRVRATVTAERVVMRGEIPGEIPGTGEITGGTIPGAGAVPGGEMWSPFTRLPVLVTSITL